MPILLHIAGTASEDVQKDIMTSLVHAGLTPLDAATHSHSDVFTLCVDAEDTVCHHPLVASYDYRYVWTGTSTVAECTTAVLQLLTDTSAAEAGGVPDCLTDIPSRFSSTRGSSNHASFLSVVREGLASDGGLYILKVIPRMPLSQLRHFCNARSLSYVEAAQLILEYLVDTSISPAVLYLLLVQAYDASRWSGLTNICPLSPLLHDTPTVGELAWASDVSVMELYHGPTAAFKDFALQIFPRYFRTAVTDAKRRVSKMPPAAAVASAVPTETLTATTEISSPSSTFDTDEYIILAATSGDTGVAAISGFVNAGKAAKVAILYPMHGVSPVQQLQMLSFDDGRHVRVYGLPENFDFCQKTVKSIFRNDGLKARLEALQPPRRLSSANSINWGRLIPQVVYYFWAYRHLVRGSHAVSQFGDPIDFVVPCGNFGNILAGYMAKQMGLPVRRLIVASNQNDVLCEFVQTGCYDVRNRPLAVTASPSIDILKASNVERLLYLLSDGDTDLVGQHMRQLETEGHFTLSSNMYSRMAETFVAGRCSEEECAAAILDVFHASGNTRILDPHTAVAVHVARMYRETEQTAALLAGKAQLVPPLVVASTAHWAKFPEPVLQALRGRPMDLGPPAASLAAAVLQVRSLYAEVATLAPGTAVHPSLSAAIDTAEKIAAAPREVAADLGAVVMALEEFASV